jgi:hypothetical protein
MQTKWDFAGSTDMWSTSAGGHLMKVVNLTGFTVLGMFLDVRFYCKLTENRINIYLPQTTLHAIQPIRVICGFRAA